MVEVTSQYISLSFNDINRPFIFKANGKVTLNPISITILGALHR